MKIPTTDQLRDRVDSGQTGEKVAMPDPAAAPLGTDAEAGGHPPTAQERSLAARRAPRSEGPARPLPGPAIYLAVIALAAVVIIMVVAMALA